MAIVRITFIFAHLLRYFQHLEYFQLGELSPHLQQNGYNNGAANVSNGQLSNYGQQPRNGAQWSGQNTLTYTQTMIPPGNAHTNFCK